MDETPYAENIDNGGAVVEIELQTSRFAVKVQLTKVDAN
jgi:hypothetical protein